MNLGNPGLTALWNLHPDNLEACRAKDRDFLPSLENYFEEAIEQLDPKNEVDYIIHFVLLYYTLSLLR